MIPIVPEIPYQLFQDMGMAGYEPLHSSYLSIMNKQGEVWHLFDISRIPLGRAAQKAATFIRGRHKPTWDPKKVLELGDKVVFVNASKIRTTGNKRK